ncbi:MAG: hypothetical protein OXU67_03465 [Chloroflexota bacterium]|nr:hypothetical protein [Chloroflexota bacterium]
MIHMAGFELVIMAVLSLFALGIFGYLGRLVILTVQRWLLARRESPQLPNDLAERLLRIERRLGDVEEEQRQLRTEVDWQGKLLQRPDAE